MLKSITAEIPNRPAITPRAMRKRSSKELKRGEKNDRFASSSSLSSTLYLADELNEVEEEEDNDDDVAVVIVRLSGQFRHRPCSQHCPRAHRPSESSIEQFVASNSYRQR